ncbi:MAG TPA: DUF1697 domain-containing protein, partial [Devosia sp.]|nr:DUF1697 domain-containing protein [Devosia sp.]
MTRYAAFLRGVNLGKRTVRSAELKAAFEAMGFGAVKTLLASGNVLFETRPGKGLKATIEAGLKQQFGFEVGTVLRSADELEAMVAADPFKGVPESEAVKLHVMLFDLARPLSVKLEGLAGDYDFPGATEREVFIYAYRK